MRAIVQRRYGSVDVLEFRDDVAAPTIGDDEMLVRVRATSVHADIWHAMRGVPYVMRIMGSGLRAPKHHVPGIDLAGVVESVGRRVSRFELGDEVLGQTVAGNLWRNGGAFAEYAAVPAARFERKPDGLTFEQAAAVATSGSLGVQAVRDEGRVQAGQEVLVNGAGGAVGTFAVQIAKSYGATVTGVDSTEKLDVIRSIGADREIDYTSEDFTRLGRRYDAVLDIVGNHAWRELRRVMKPSGSYVLIGHDRYGAAGHRWLGSFSKFGKLVLMAPFVKQVHPFRAAKDPGDRLAVVTELVGAGKITPVVDKVFPLEEVPAAMRYLESGQARGRVVITLEG